MSDFYTDYDSAQQYLREAISNAEQHLHAHNSHTPSFPQQSAGRGFVGHGRAIQDLLTTMHDRTQWRLENALATFSAATSQHEHFLLADESNAHSLGKDRVG